MRKISSRDMVNTPFGDFLFEPTVEMPGSQPLFKTVADLVRNIPSDLMQSGVFREDTLKGYIHLASRAKFNRKTPLISGEQFSKLIPYVEAAIANKLKDTPADFIEASVNRVRQFEIEIYGKSYGPHQPPAFSRTELTKIASTQSRAKLATDPENGLLELGLSEKDIEAAKKIPAKNIIAYLEIGQQMRDAGIEAAVHEAASRDPIKFRLALHQLNR